MTHSNINAVTELCYSTNNQERLDDHKHLFALTSHEWAGFRQWLDIGRKVKKGAKGCEIFMVCEKKIESKEQTKEEEKNKRTVIKSRYVFNKDHTEALEQQTKAQ